MASKAISVGVGIPMIVAGALIAIFLPQYDVEIGFDAIYGGYVFFKQ